MGINFPFILHLFPVALLRSLSHADSFLRTKRPQYRLKRFPYIFCNDLLAFRRRMDPVSLIKFGDAGDALEQKRDERRVVSLGKVDKNLPKLPGIRLPHIGRGLHAGNNEPRARKFCSGPIDDRLQVSLGYGGGDAPQAIVAPQLENENIDFRL